MNSIADRDERVATVFNALGRCAVEPVEPIVVACSGGSDSTSLAALVAHAGYRPVICAHFDHGIRSEAESARDMSAVGALARRIDAQLEVGRAERGRLAAEAGAAGESIEDHARTARYSFLVDVCRSRHARMLAVGHTRDDQVETVLMRLFQGTELDGITGMRLCAPLPFDHSITLIRPVLELDRSALRDYLEATGIGFTEDPSNADTRFLRNRLRREVLPVVEAAFPAARRAVFETAGRLSEVADYIRVEAERALTWRADCNSGPSPTELMADRETFFSLPGPMRRRVLFIAVDRLGARRRRVPYRFLDSIPADDPGGGRRIVARGHGLRIDLEDRWIVCRRDIVPKGDRGYLYCVARSLDESSGRSDVLELEVRGRGGRRELVRLARNRLSLPLLLRPRRPGDSIRLAAGRRSLKRVFQDHSIPQGVRDMVPVLEDRLGIVGICGGVVGVTGAWRRDMRVGAEATDAAPMRVVIDFNEVISSYAGQ
ncbi:MAG: tRNA lysidine(34) synthetase TilS [Spirochaetes bacterium]|jgi:tRNA(Ile)-lysidine synthase|nr:tRNA lysidine(34) synthetase TilS [Spirochaetota bacterium]